MVESSDHNKNRKKFVDILNKINSVANPDGKGRDDLEVEILLQSEGICRRISSSQSKAVRKLAEGIKKSFATLRELMRKYGENIEGVFWEWTQTIKATLDGKDLTGSSDWKEIDSRSGEECRTQAKQNFDGVKMKGTDATTRTIGTQSSQSSSTN